tara:strand:+ start:1427 stop:1837 length:411 start_codon:yes stop_codon:yes gene_type:complete
VSGWRDVNGYLLTRIEGQLLRNHHIAWFKMTGSWPDKELDHIDNNPSNNRWCNLRAVTREEQGMNQKLQTRREGKWKGVHMTSSGKYGVKIKKSGKTVNGIGNRFTDPREAALVYNYYAEKLFGPYANFNNVFVDT